MLMVLYDDADALMRSPTHMDAPGANTTALIRTPAASTTITSSPAAVMTSYTTVPVTVNATSPRLVRRVSAVYVVGVLGVMRMSRELDAGKQSGNTWICHM